MGSFEKKRSDMIRKKNDVYVKSMELNDQIEAFDKKRTDVEEGISRIPSDLPEELQQQVDAAVENVRNDMNDQSEQLGKEADDVKREADEAIDMAREIADDLQEKSKKMSALSDIPLIGNFAESKGEQLADQAEQMIDLSQETMEYQDRLANQRNKLYNKR